MTMTFIQHLLENEPTPTDNLLKVNSKDLLNVLLSAAGEQPIQENELKGFPKRLTVQKLVNIYENRLNESDTGRWDYDFNYDDDEARELGADAPPPPEKIPDHILRQFNSNVINKVNDYFARRDIEPVNIEDLNRIGDIFKRALSNDPQEIANIGRQVYNSRDDEGDIGAEEEELDVIRDRAKENMTQKYAGVRKRNEENAARARGRKSGQRDPRGDAAEERMQHQMMHGAEEEEAKDELGPNPLDVDDELQGRDIPASQKFGTDAWRDKVRQDYHNIKDRKRNK